MDRRRKANFLEERDKIPYEELLSENHIICDIYFKDGKCYKISGYDVEIGTDKLYVLRKIGKVEEKSIFPISNILAIKQYYLKLPQRNIEEIEPVKYEVEEEEIQEMKKEEAVWLPGKKGRELAAKQFKKLIATKDRDIIKPEDLKVKEDEEEKSVKISGQALLEGKIGNE